MRMLILALFAISLTPALVAAYPPPGTPAPDFSLPDSAGNYHYLSDYRGKVVMLNFWQSG